MARAAHKRFPWGIYSVLLLLILVGMFAPIGSVMLCGLLAHTYGCTVDEGSVHPCIIGGTDRGELLYSLGVLGWFMLITLPAGALAFVAWLVIVILHRRSWRKQLPPELPTV